jgi:hypothetical protein
VTATTHIDGARMLGMPQVSCYDEVDATHRDAEADGENVYETIDVVQQRGADPDTGIIYDTVI